MFVIGTGSAVKRKVQDPWRSHDLQRPVTLHCLLLIHRGSDNPARNFSQSHFRWVHPPVSSLLFFDLMCVNKTILFVLLINIAVAPWSSSGICVLIYQSKPCLFLFPQVLPRMQSHQFWELVCALSSHFHNYADFVVDIPALDVPRNQVSDRNDVYSISLYLTPLCSSFLLHLFGYHLNSSFQIRQSFTFFSPHHFSKFSSGSLSHIWSLFLVSPE